MVRKPFSLPRELEIRLEEQFGKPALAGMIQALQMERAPTFRANTLKTDDQRVMAYLREANIRYERIKTIPHAFRVLSLSSKELLDRALFKSGEAYLQGESSMMPAFALDPQKNETILDLCAAPGSKTTQIAAMMQNTGKIIACEENQIRFEKLVHNLALQGVTNTEARHTDATLIHKELPEHFDRVLADVPCSAEGRINLFEPRTFRFWSEKNIVAHAKLQRRLLRSAVQCLKPGGTLVYSTCTLAPEENQWMIDWALVEFAELSLAQKPTQILPSKTQEGFFLAKFEKHS